MGDNRTGTTSGNQARGGSQGMQGGAISDQAQSAMRGAADTASEMMDTAYEQGERYLRQGRQVVGNLDGATLGGLVVAGAVGFGLAWLLFGQHSRSADEMTRRMSQSSDRYRPDDNRSSRRH